VPPKARHHEHISMTAIGHAAWKSPPSFICPYLPRHDQKNQRIVEIPLTLGAHGFRQDTEAATMAPRLVP
jgi:hypothetical protein